MKRQLIGVLTGLAFAGTMVLAQSATAQNPTTSQAKVPDVTLTGCLIQGTSPDTFVLDNARTAMQSKTDKGQSYFLVAGTEDLGFAHEVNHEVTVTGAADQTAVVTPPPAGQKTAERDLPKLSAKSLTMVSDRCDAASR